MSKKGAIVNVVALRSAEEIEEFKWALGYVGKQRDVLMFTFGINTGLRVSDILPLKVKDVRGETNIIIREKKTKKKRDVYLNDGLRDDIERYTKFMDDEDYVFASRKGDKPISTTQAYRIMVSAGQLLNRADIGTHTMRKTYGYMHYKRFKNVAILQEIFNHSTPAVTLRYIGITQEDIEETQKGWYL